METLDLLPIITQVQAQHTAIKAILEKSLPDMIGLSELLQKQINIIDARLIVIEKYLKIEKKD